MSKMSVLKFAVHADGEPLELPLRTHRELTREQLSQTIQQAEGGSFRAYVGRLKTRGIIIEEGGRLKLSPIMLRGGA